MIFRSVIFVPIIVTFPYFLHEHVIHYPFHHLSQVHLPFPSSIVVNESPEINPPPFAATATPVSTTYCFADPNVKKLIPLGNGEISSSVTTIVSWRISVSARGNQFRTFPVIIFKNNRHFNINTAFFQTININFFKMNIHLL